MKEVTEEKLISPVHRLLLQCTWYFEKSKVSLSPFKIKMLGKSCARNKTLTKTCTCVCVFSCMYMNTSLQFALMCYCCMNCSAVLQFIREERGKTETGDAGGWLYNCSSISEVLIIWIMQAIFFFLTVLLGQRKWASLVNRSNCLCNSIDYVFKMAYAAGL